jgi:dihydrofolate reductase
VRTPDIELVVAAAENGVIGRDNALPWRLPADLRRFKAITLGKPVLMGRSTHESIGRPLPGRTNYVLSRTEGYSAAGCAVVRDIDTARIRAAGCAALMVIGGADVYRQCLPLASRIHLTLVHARVAGDTVFDGWRGGEWRETGRERGGPDAEHEFAYSFITLERG